jgi:hypothetical protein
MGAAFGGLGLVARKPSIFAGRQKKGLFSFVLFVLLIFSFV